MKPLNWQMCFFPSLSRKTGIIHIFLGWSRIYIDNLPHGHTNSTALSHNIAPKDPGHRNTPQNIILTHYISEKEVAIILESLFRHMCSRRWKRSPTKIQEPITREKYLGAQWSWAWQITLQSKRKMIISCTYHQWEKSTMPGRQCVGSEGNIPHTGEFCSDSFTRIIEGCWLQMEPRLSSGYRASSPDTWAIWCNRKCAIGSTNGGKRWHEIYGKSQ